MNFYQKYQLNWIIQNNFKKNKISISGLLKSFDWHYKDNIMSSRSCETILIYFYQETADNIDNKLKLITRKAYVLINFAIV